MDYRPPDPRPQVLSLGDVASPTWQRIKSYYTQRLAELRERNDNPSLSHEESVALRAQIQEVKRLLAMETPPPVIHP